MQNTHFLDQEIVCKNIEAKICWKDSSLLNKAWVLTSLTFNLRSSPSFFDKCTKGVLLEKMISWASPKPFSQTRTEYKLSIRKDNLEKYLLKTSKNMKSQEKFCILYKEKLCNKTIFYLL